MSQNIHNFTLFRKTKVVCAQGDLNDWYELWRRYWEGFYKVSSQSASTACKEMLSKRSHYGGIWYKITSSRASDCQLTLSSYYCCFLAQEQSRCFAQPGEEKTFCSCIHCNHLDSLIHSTYPITWWGPQGSRSAIQHCTTPSWFKPTENNVKKYLKDHLAVKSWNTNKAWPCKCRRRSFGLCSNPCSCGRRDLWLYFVCLQ